MADSFLEKPKYINKSTLVKPVKTGVKTSIETKNLTNIQWRRIVIPLAIFIVALLPRILDLGTFMTADEDDQIMFANHFLKSALRGDFSGVLILGYPGVPTLIFATLGVGVRYLAHYTGLAPLTWVNDDFFPTLNQLTSQGFGVFQYPGDFLVWAQVPLALVATLSILGIYVISKRLLNERVALLAALILAFDPFILAHSRVIHVDAPMSYFMFLSFLAFLLYLDKGAWRWLIISGLFGGLAGLSKMPAALLGPILIVTGAIYALFPPPDQPRLLRWKRLAVALVVWGLIAVAAIFALWPAMWTRPIFTIQSILRNITAVSLGHNTTGIFWGGRLSDQNPLYYLIVFPYHLTPLTSVGVVAGLAMIMAGLVAWFRKVDNWLTRALPIALGLVAYAVIFVAPITSISKRGDRYVLPIFFASGLLAALGLWWLGTVLQKYLPQQFNLTAAKMVGTIVVVQTVFVLFYHPYYLAYFNPLLGSYRTAPSTINIGWGEGLDLAADYLNNLDTDEPPLVAAWYRNQFAAYYNGPTIDLSNQEAALTADYTVFYINQVQRGFPSKEILNYFRQREPVHVVELGGIEYAWIYEGPVIGQEPQKNHIFPTEALLGGAARLYGLDIPVTEIPADTYAFSQPATTNGSYLGYQETGEGLPVTLYWETKGSIQDNHGKTNVYIRLIDDMGNIWGEVDRLILTGLWRPIRWNPGYFLRDEYKLPINPATPPGTYHFEVGLYDFETGKSYGVVKNIGQITLTSPQKIADKELLQANTKLTVPLNKSLTMVGHTFTDVDLRPGAEIVGKIFWEMPQTTDKDYQLQFSFIDKDNKQYIVNEQPLATTTYPLSNWHKNEVMGTAYRFRVPAIAIFGKYQMAVNILDPETGQTGGEVIPLATVFIDTIRRNFELPEDVVPVSAILNGEIELVGYKLHDQTVKARETFGLTLYWRNLQLLDTNYTVFVHAVAPDHTIRGQWDSVPMDGLAPTSGWLPNEIIIDHYEVPMNRKSPAWKYDIFVGMYNPLTGQRLSMYSPNAPMSEDRVWISRVQLVE